MRVIQACWEDVGAGMAEAKRVGERIRALYGPRLDEARRRWITREARTRQEVLNRAAWRMLLFPVWAAVFALGWFALVGRTRAALQAGSPAFLAGWLARPAPSWALGAGLPWLQAAFGVLIAARGLWVVAAWRRAKRHRWVEPEECPYPDGDPLPRLWKELGRWPAGMEGLRETEGSEGERSLAVLLAKFLDDRYLCLLGPLVAESLDVDILVLGPTGLWVLDSKFHRGRVAYLAGTFVKTKVLGNRTVEKEFDIVRAMDREVDGVRRAVVEAGSPDLAAHIHRAVVFTHPEVSLETLGTPFPCLLPKQVPTVVLNGPPAPALSLEACLGIVDALARQARRLATKDADRIKVSALRWVKEEARSCEDGVADHLRREESSGPPRVRRGRASADQAPSERPVVRARRRRRRSPPKP